MATAAAVTVEASVVTCGFVTVAVFLAVDSITGSDDEVVTVSVGFRISASANHNVLSFDHCA